MKPELRVFHNYLLSGSRNDAVPDKTVITHLFLSSYLMNYDVRSFVCPLPLV